MTQGLKIGQLALFFGANDMGSLMIEENVVASAGTVHYLTLEQIKDAIREPGYVPRQRNVFYELIDEPDRPGRGRPPARRQVRTARRGVEGSTTESQRTQRRQRQRKHICAIL